MQVLLSNPVDSLEWKSLLVVEPKLTLRQKLATKRLDMGLTQGEIGEVLGIEQATVSLYERNPNKLKKAGLDFAVKFIRAYGFTASEADMLAKELFSDILEHFSLPGRGVTDKGPKVRLLGEIGAGLSTGAAAGDSTLVSVPDWIAEKYDLNDVFAVDCVGSSMTCEIVAKTIPEGSRVFFHAKLQPYKGEVIACYLKAHDMSVMKLYMPEKNYAVLESYNPLYRSKAIIIDENNPGEIQGVYLAHTVAGPRLR